MNGIKDGVKLLGIQPQVVLGILIITPILKEYGQDLFITAGVDGQHMNKSEHYQGNAVDLRFWDIPEATREECANKCRTALGAEFDFVIENDHYHMEWQPKQV